MAAVLVWTGRAVAVGALVLAMAFDVMAEARPPRDGVPLPHSRELGSQSRIDPFLSIVASELGGRSAEVRCWSTEDWQKRNAEYVARLRTVRNQAVSEDFRIAGMVSHDHKRLSLPAESCNILEASARYQWWPTSGPATTRWRIASTFHVFAHELQHVRGERNEVKAECWGVQWVRAVAQRLGFDGPDADAVAHYAWRNVYPFNRDEFSSECRDGGRLDLDPASSRWP